MLLTASLVGSQSELRKSGIILARFFGGATQKQLPGCDAADLIDSLRMLSGSLNTATLH